MPNTPVPRHCQARVGTRRKSRPCSRRATPGTDYCRLHQGKAKDRRG